MDQVTVYEYLKSVSAPQTIREINEQPQFQDISRRELAQTLQALAREGIVFRGMKDGKAYYSADVAMGEARNPVQEGISEVTAKMNRSVKREMSTEEMQNQVFADLMEALGGTVVNTEKNVKITYSQNITIETDNYIVAVPDGFKYRIDENGAVVMWLPNDEDPEEDIISLVRLTDEGMRELKKIYGRPVDTLYAFYNSACFKLKNEFNETVLINAKPYLKKGIVGQYITQRLAGLGTRMVLLEKNGMQHFQLNVYQDYIKESEIETVVIEWMERYQPKRVYPVPTEIDDPAILNSPLNQDSLNRLSKQIAFGIENIVLKKNWNDEAIIADYQYKEARGVGTYTEAIAEIKANLQRAAEEVEEYAKKCADILKTVSEKNPDNPLLFKLYEKAVENFDIENDALTMTVDEKTYSHKISTLAESKKSFWTPQMQALKDAEKSEEERKKKELEERIKKEEEEKRRKEEEAQRAQEEQDRIDDERAKNEYEKNLKEWEETTAARKAAIQQLSEKIEKQEQQLERLCEEKLEMEQNRIENEKFRIGDRMVEVQREISTSQDQLKKLGLFKMGEKNRLKEKIQNLQKEYADLKDAHAAKDIEYAKRCDELTLEANTARVAFYSQPEALQYLIYSTIKKSRNSMTYTQVITALSHFGSAKITDQCFDTLQILVDKNILDVKLDGIERNYFIAKETEKPMLILPSAARKEAERKKREEEERKRKEEEAEAKRIAIKKIADAKKREAEKEAVYSAIFYDTTVQDVARELGMDDTMKVAGYIKELLMEGRIEKTVRNGRSYFSCKL